LAVDLVADSRSTRRRGFRDDSESSADGRHRSAACAYGRNHTLCSVLEVSHRRLQKKQKTQMKQMKRKTQMKWKKQKQRCEHRGQSHLSSSSY